jgi:hypothetical protein
MQEVLHKAVRQSVHGLKQGVEVSNLMYVCYGIRVIGSPNFGLQWVGQAGAQQLLIGVQGLHKWPSAPSCTSRACSV